MPPFSLYLHIPFCRHRCGYCDFNTYSGMEDLIPAYVQALCREIDAFASGAGIRLPIHTIFFGGGTPSLLPIAELGIILDAVQHHFNIVSSTEITLELNPGTVDLEYMRGLKRLGFNRLSIGVQSASSEELRLLERGHTYLHSVQSVKFARQAGFDNISLDLIFALPYQTLASWQQNIELVLGLHPDHFSLYALTIEHGTPFQNMVARGLLPTPDPDLAAEMYSWSMDRLAAAAFHQYEISNWAGLDAIGQPKMSQHNLQYWLNRPYIGLGAGAHGYVDNIRTSNVLSPAAYIERLSPPQQDRRFPATPASIRSTAIDRPTEMAETMMMGLRLVQSGISERHFEKRFDVSLEKVYGKEINDLFDLELLEWNNENGDRSLRLTPRGRLLGNQVFMRFVE